MPVVNFSTSRDAAYLNTITMTGNGLNFTFGPNAGTTSINLVSGGVYNLTAGSNLGSPQLRRLSASCIGLEDSNDNDFNDLIVCAGSGSFLNNSQYQAPWDPVVINSFTYRVISGNVVEFNWSTTAAVSVSIDNGIGSVGLQGPSTSINTGLQSVAGSNSPATRTYTLTATGGGGDVQTAQVQVQIFNDGTPNDFSISSRSNLNPGALETIYVGKITGIDITITANAGPGVQISTNNFSWTSGSVSITNNIDFWVRANAPQFNTNPSGLTNSSTFYVDVGPLRRFFTLTTRAPDVSETFNISNYDDKLPYPDIDTIPGSPDQYIITAPLTVDDVEIPVEFRSNNSNIQIRVKRSGASSWDNWQDVRST